MLSDIIYLHASRQHDRGNSGGDKHVKSFQFIFPLKIYNVKNYI